MSAEQHLGHALVIDLMDDHPSACTLEEHSAHVAWGMVAMRRLVFRAWVFCCRTCAALIVIPTVVYCREWHDPIDQHHRPRQRQLGVCGRRNEWLRHDYHPRVDGSAGGRCAEAMGPVERAVRTAIAPGSRLPTPTGQGKFVVAALRADALVLLLGEQQAWTSMAGTTSRDWCLFSGPETG